MKKEAGSHPLKDTQNLAQLVGSQFDERTDGNALAQSANFSRSYFQRWFYQQASETPSRCRRRLLLERAGYQLLHSQLPITQIAFEAGFDSLEGFSRAFRKATQQSPSQYRKGGSPGWHLPAPNAIHYDPVIGAALRLPPADPQGGTMDLTDRLTDFDAWMTRRILESARTLPEKTLDAPLTGFDNPLLYTGEEKTLRDMLDRLVYTKEVWMASVHGRPMPEASDRSVDGMLARMETAFNEYALLVKKVRDEDLWNTSFMDMLCDPPETFTYGGMISHVTAYSDYRRMAAIEALTQAGVNHLGNGDPMAWKR